MDISFFESPAAFRDWLEANHAAAPELWVGFHKKATGRPSLTWPESVDQALCFGWIDGVRRSIDDEAYTIRFTSRKPASRWSRVNNKRFQELMALGLVRPAGVAAFERGKEANSVSYSYEAGERPGLNEDELRAFRANETAWAYFESQAPSYRRLAGFWVADAKREETRRRRLATLIEESENARRLDPMSYGRAKR